MTTTALLIISVRAVFDPRTKVSESVQPFIVGFCVFFIVSGYSHNSGGSMSPARDFGPRLFLLLAGYPTEVISYKNYNFFWIPIVAPFAGSAIGTYIYEFCIGIHLPPLNSDDEMSKRKLTLGS